jgi:hypothetical protein
MSFLISNPKAEVLSNFELFWSPQEVFLIFDGKLQLFGIKFEKYDTFPAAI